MYSMTDKRESFIIPQLCTCELYAFFVFSDITVKLADQEIPAHKFVLSARSDFFGDSILAGTPLLGNANDRSNN